MRIAPWTGPAQGTGPATSVLSAPDGEVDRKPQGRPSSFSEDEQSTENEDEHCLLRSAL